MSDYRVFFLPVLLASVFAGSTAAMDLTVSASNSQTHIYTHIHTPIPEPAPLFAELEKSYQTAGVCFIGFGDCGGNTDFGRSDEGFTLPDCASIGYPLTSCTPPGYPDKFCPYDSNHFASCRQDKPKACTDAGFVSGCGQGEILDPDGLCPYDAAYGKCVCDPCSGYDYTYEEATEKGYEVDGAACDSCGTKKYKRRNASCSGYLVCDCGPEIGSSSCQSGTLELSLQPVRNVAPTNVRWTNVRTAPSALWKTVRANIARRAAQPAWPTLKITGATALCGTGFRSRQAARQRRINQRTEEKDYV